MFTSNSAHTKARVTFKESNDNPNEHHESLKKRESKEEAKHQVKKSAVCMTFTTASRTKGPGPKLGHMSLKAKVKSPCKATSA